MVFPFICGLDHPADAPKRNRIRRAGHGPHGSEANGAGRSLTRAHPTGVADGIDLGVLESGWMDLPPEKDQETRQTKNETLAAWQKGSRT